LKKFGKETGRGGHWEKTVECVGTSMRTIRDILLEFEEHGRLLDDDKNEGNKVNHDKIIFSSRVENDIVQFIRERQAKQQQTFANDVQQCVLAKYHIELSLRSIRRRLSELNLTVQAAHAR